MLKVDVRIKDGASGELRRLLRAVSNRREINAHMGEAVKAGVVDHLRGLNTRSPNTSFYAKAAISAERARVFSDEKMALVTVPHRGMALRFHGGRVLPVRVKNLALPTKDVPLASGGNEGRMGPREMGLLAFLPARRNGVAVTTGYLVEGMEKFTRAGRRRVVPKPGGKLLYVLRGWTDHDPDPTVLPKEDALSEMAAAGAEAYIRTAR